MMKLAVATLLASSAAAFAPAMNKASSTAMNAFTMDNMPGALSPMGFFDPLGFAEKADEKTLKRYREAEVTHGRVAMLAVATLLASSAAAFAPAMNKASSTAMNAFTVDNMPGALPPMGFFDPLGFAEKADEKTLKRYREAEVTHGRVAMLAVIGFFVGEAVAGSSFLFDGQITGPAISHFTQVPDGWDALIVTFIGAAEAQRAQTGWVDPADASYDQPGLLKDDYYPGDIGFDPLGIRPEDPEELDLMITKELQNGRLAMLAAAGFLAQEAVDGLGIVEHYQVSMIEKADFGL